MKDYTDEELLDQFYFNYQVSYALGIRNLGDLYIAPRTLYEFREKVVDYTKEHPDEADLVFKQFELLTENFIKVAKLKTGDQRSDSTQIIPNIKKAGRLSLAFDSCPLKQACRVKIGKRRASSRIPLKSLHAAEAREKIATKAIRRETTSKRAAIEGTNSSLKRSQGAYKLSVRGIIKSTIDVVLNVRLRTLAQCG